MAWNHLESAQESLRNGRAPIAERRRSERVGTVLRVAVLVRGDARQLCQVRNISAGGLSARVFCKLVPGEAVEIELTPHRRVSGRVAWRRRGEAGIAFDDPIADDELLAAGALRCGWRARLPRLPVDRLAMIRAGADISFASTRDISQGGVRVVCDRAPPKGARIVVTLEGLRPLAGVVRWERDGCCGISFNQIISTRELRRWLAT
jgi:hypothetical protein